MRSPHDIGRAFVAAMEAGILPDDLCCDDMTAWTTTQVEQSLTRYRGALEWLREKTSGTVKFTIDAITAEGERAVIEARSTAQLINGDDYANTYVFVLTLRDGKIASVREHFNALIVREKLIPLMV